MSHLKSTLLATTMLALLAAPALADVPAGVAAAVNPQANATPPAGATRVLEVGSNVVMNEKVQTGAEGQTQLLFRDGSTVTVGPGADLTIDTFVYDPDKRTAKLAMTAASGLIRFVGGRASKEEGGVTVTTPSATIGIRGGIADIGHDTQTGTTNVNFLFGTGLDVKTPNSQTSLNTPGFGFTIGKDGSISPPQPVTNQTLAQNNKKIEGKGGKGGANGNNAPNSPDNNAGGVSNANSSAPPPPPPLNNTLSQFAQGDNLQKTITTITNDQSSGRDNTVSSGFGSTSSPILFGGKDKVNIAGVVPQTGSPPVYLAPGDNESHPTFTYTESSGGQTYGTGTESASINIGITNNQLKTLDFTNTISSTSTYGGQSYGPYVSVNTTHVDFVGTTLGNIVVDKDVALGVLQGGSIVVTESHTYTYPGSQNSTTNNSDTYILAPTDMLPLAFGTTPTGLISTPANTTWTYFQTGATPVYFTDNSTAPGKLSNTSLLVQVVRGSADGFNNLIGALKGDIAIGGHNYALTTAIAQDVKALIAGIDGSGGLTGNTARGDISGQVQLVSLDGGTFCATTCVGQANGFFAGPGGRQIALAYMAPGGYRYTAPYGNGAPIGTQTLGIVGAVSLTRK